MEPKICLALGGGAARGLAHLGVLRVFEDARVPFHMMTGTSLGAMVGALYATNPDATYWMERIEKFLRSFRSRRTRLEFIRRLERPSNSRHGFFSDMANLIRKGFFWGVTATQPAFISEDEYEELVNPLIPDILIENLKLPFGCVATDIRYGKRVLLTSGSLRKAVSASCSLPGIFPPVEYKGMLLVDGGWVERVPVLAARDMGADIIIAIDVSSEIAEFEDRSGLDIVLRSDAVTRVYLNELLANDADVIIHPGVGSFHWADFSDPHELYRRGETAAREKVMSIKAVIHRAVAPQRRLVDQIKQIRDKIMERVSGGKS